MAGMLSRKISWARQRLTSLTPLALAGLALIIACGGASQPGDSAAATAVPVVSTSSPSATKARARLQTRSPRIPSHHQRGQPRHFFRTLQPQLLLNGAAWLSRKGNSLWSISASIACLCPTYCLTHLAGHRAFCHWIGLKKIGSWLSWTRSCPFYIRNTERRELCLG